MLTKKFLTGRHALKMLEPSAINMPKIRELSEILWDEFVNNCRPTWEEGQTALEGLAPSGRWFFEIMMVAGFWPDQLVDADGNPVEKEVKGWEDLLPKDGEDGEED